MDIKKPPYCCKAKLVFKSCGKGKYDHFCSKCQKPMGVKGLVRNQNNGKL